MNRFAHITGFERIISLIGAGLVVIFLSMLFYEVLWNEEVSQRQKLRYGQVTELEGTVFKSVVSPHEDNRAIQRWEPIHKDDVIQTMEHSRVTISSLNLRVTAGANSQLRISERDEKIALDLISGRFLVESDTQNQFIANTTHQKLNLDMATKSALVVFTSDESTILQNLTGIVNFRAEDGTPFELSQDQLVEVDRSIQIVDPEIQLLNPLDAERISKDRRVKFSWNSPMEHEEFQLSDDPLFDSYKKVKIQGLKELVSDIGEEEELYWRVLADGTSSVIGKFTHVTAAQPIMSLSSEPSVSVGFGELAQVTVEIMRPTRSQEVILQVINSSNQLHEKIKTTDFRQKLNLPPGFFKIRGVALYEENLTSSWSAPLTVEVREKLVPQQLRSADLNRVLIIRNAGHPSELLDASIEDMQGYISSQTNFSSFFRPLQGDDHHYEVAFDNSEIKDWSKAGFPASEIYPGTYRFKFRSTSPDKAPSNWSRSKYVEIRLQAPFPFPTNTEAATDRFKKVPVHLSWTPLLLTPYYEVQLSQSVQFENKESFIAESAEMDMLSYPEQKYYWRVRALNSEFKPISGFSNFEHFFVPLTEFIPPLAESNFDAPIPSRRPADSAELRTDYKEETYFKKYWAWLSMGANYVNYLQNIDSQGPLTFSSYAIPSTYVEVGAKINPNWAARAMYKRSPGNIDNSKNGDQNINYSWDTVSVEALKKFYGDESFHKFYFLAGVQDHSQPMLTVRSKSTNNRVLTLLNNRISLLSLGVEYAYLYTPKMRFSMNQKLMYPFAYSNKNGGQLNIAPSLFYDGSLGAQYQAWNATWLGFYWYGQLHQYDYDLKLSSENIKGKQDLFFSNLELRLGLEF